MAFTPIALIAEGIGTSKATESITVQVTDVRNRAGQVTRRIEARIYVDNGPEGYQGFTKTALVFVDPEAIGDMIAALQEGLTHLPGFEKATTKAATKTSATKKAPAKKAAPRKRTAA